MNQSEAVKRAWKAPEVVKAVRQLEKELGKIESEREIRRRLEEALWTGALAIA